MVETKSIKIKGEMVERQVRTELATDFLGGLVHEYFRNKLKVRDVFNSWLKRDKLDACIQANEKRMRGPRGQGCRAPLSYQKHKNFIRGRGGGKPSAVREVFAEVKLWFEKRRHGGV